MPAPGHGGRGREFLRPAVLLALHLALAPNASGAEETPTLEAAAAEDREIRLDGVPDEDAWARAAPATRFTQREPRPGEPATEDTEIRVLASRHTLYIGIRALDREPARIIADEMGLDSSLYRDDSIVVVLDTFHDHRNAYFFETNPNGSRTDALVSEEGRNTNFDWDGVWTVRAARGPQGWTAEMAIPFSTLRWEASSPVWGINFRRIIRRKNEEVFWAPIPLDADIFRMSMAGQLRELNLPEPRLNLSLKPFGTASSSTVYDAGGRHADRDSEAGIDLRWGVTRGLSLDLTYNTDFAETEVDDQQVNLTRFDLYFPEKREFFLENAGIFEFGLEGESYGTPLIKPFFSRRIGLSPEGAVVPIDWGLRLTGRAGRWSLGVLDVQTAATETAAGESIPQNNWGALRLKRNVGELSSIGLLATSRDAGGGDFSRMAGLDTVIRPRQELALHFFGLGSETPGMGESDTLGGTGAFWEGKTWDWSVESTRIGRDFKAEEGFLLRRGVRRDSLDIDFEPRPRRAKVRNWLFGTRLEIFDRQDGPRETAYWGTTLFGFRLQNEFEMSIRWHHDMDRLFEPFEIQPGVVIPPGTYPVDWIDIPFSTNPGAPVSAEGSLEYGEWYDGHSLWVRLTMRARASRFLRAEADWEHNRSEFKAGDIETNIIRQRIDLSFTPEATASLFAQYNDAADLLSLNARLIWRYRPGSELFVVYNQNWNADDLDDPATRDRSLTFKLAHRYQL